MTWLNKFIAYGLDPHKVLPKAQAIQAAKMEAHTLCLTRDLGVSRKEALLAIANSARARAHDGPPTLFIVNCGSSGSHWIEGMLAESPGLRACREVYFPAPLSAQIRASKTRERIAIVDAVHQVHAQGIRPVGATDILINSAHSWSPATLLGRPARCVLLIRDPLDTVLSRTFRKPEWKERVAPSTTDAEYLETNIAFVLKFFETASKHVPAAVIRYEDVQAAPAPALRTMLDVLGLDASDEQLLDICNRHSADSQIASGARLSNLFTGARHDYDPALEQRAIHALRGLREEFGYPLTQYPA